MPANAGDAGTSSERERVASGSNSSGGTLADRYAAALYAQAEDTRALDPTVEEMDALGRLIDESAPLRRLLNSPLIDVTQARTAAIATLAEQGFGKLVQDFVASSPITAG